MPRPRSAAEPLPVITDAPAAFAALCREASACRRCPAMAGRRRVLSAANGRPGARVMFVAEAPGRLGADVSGVPLSGDRAGQRFEALLRSIGWSRADVFVTNAVLCNPRSDDGRRNRPPTGAEIAACRDLLARQFEVIDPPVIATLGVVALRTLAGLVPHDLRLARDVGQPSRWGSRWLVPLYHLGDRALHWRSVEEQLEDFRRLAWFADRLAAP